MQRAHFASRRLYGIPAPRLPAQQIHSRLLPLTWLPCARHCPLSLGAGHPAITRSSQYYFQHTRRSRCGPLIVLLMAQATNGLGARWVAKRIEAEQLTAERYGADAGLDWPLTRPDVLNDWNPNQPRETARFSPTFSVQPPRGAARRHRVSQPPVDTPSAPEPALAHAVLPTQIRLAQIVEMMHTASLLHDDVIDASALRRGAPLSPRHLRQETRRPRRKLCPWTRFRCSSPASVIPRQPSSLPVFWPTSLRARFSNYGRSRAPRRTRGTSTYKKHTSRPRVSWRRALEHPLFLVVQWMVRYGRRLHTRTGVISALPSRCASYFRAALPR